MKTLLSTAALTALLVSGAALADGPGMKGQGINGPGMSGSRSDMQTQMRERAHGDEEHIGKGKHEEHPGSGSAHSGPGHNNDHDNDDDHGPRHMKQMDRDHS